MTERLRTVLRRIGPGGVRGGAVILLLALALLILLLAAMWYALFDRQEAAEREKGEEEITVVLESQPEDSPLLFGPGPSVNPTRATSANGRPLGIPGLSGMDVIGELQYAPGAAFRCPGGGPAGGGLYKRTCTAFSSDDPAVYYEVTVVEDDPSTVLSVVATAENATDEAAAKVLGYVARLSIGAAGPLEPEVWVERSISSGGQYFSNGAEVRLYGTEVIRTLEIIASAPAEDQGTETTEGVTEGTTERTTNRSPK
ncbi:MAG TPA: hypothetical protein VK357_17195 [Rubrobacteraceae bacterium]|nr:hypothetical protein [Rubrobacteraceae bacterium]